METAQDKKTTARSSTDIGLSSRWGNAAKRLFDVLVSALGLLALAPAFALIAVWIKRDSPGPVFYRGPRIGKDGKRFHILKFRTMYETRKSYAGPRITSQADDRVTPFGKWLRDTKLNELPQLWNVLIGEMSLVGPRPEDPTISRTWPTQIAHELLSVRPGITSPSSILYRDEENMLRAGEAMLKYLHELSPDKMRLDQLYVRYHSFWLDLDVILWTALLLMPRIKAYTPPEQLLFVGPVTRLIQCYLNWFFWDFMIVLASISFTGMLVRIFGPLNVGWLPSVKMALGSSVLYTLVGLFLKINRINWPKASAWEAVRLWIGWAVATTAILGFYFYLGFTGLRIYGIILGASILSLFGIILVRYRARLLSGLLSRLLMHRLNANGLRERVLIVGSGRTAEHIAWLMAHPTYSGKFEIAGFIDNDLLSQGMKIYGSKVIGRFEDIRALVKQRDIGLIILADNQMASDEYRDFRNTESFSPARIVVAPDIFGSLSSLEGVSPHPAAKDNLNNFQCQYCLARYASEQVSTDDIKTAPLLNRLPAIEDRKKWIISGQERKSS